MFPEEAIADSQKSAQCDRSLVLTTQQQFGVLSTLLKESSKVFLKKEERVSCQVFHPDVLRGQRWLKKDISPQKTERGVRV